MIGIYCWTNKINNKRYVGQSVDIERRYKQHIASAGKYNTKISRALDKYGIENFSFEILEECDITELNEKENYWMNYYNSLDDNYGYNITYTEEDGCAIYGEYNPNTLLTNEDVLIIRKRVHIDKEYPKEVYEDYANHISYDSFWQLVHGVTWKNVDCSMIKPIGTDNHGSKNPRAKLNEQDVLNIRTRVHINKEDGLTVYQDYKDIVAYDTYKKALRGETWKNVDCSMIAFVKTEKIGKSKAKLTKEDVLYIRTNYENRTKTLEELKKEYPNVTPSTIRRVINYETWKDILPVSTRAEA